ncbi:MAG: molecular chaperone DnaK, partial [Paludibacteraceae bacterium]|nr:molecular chaperone DnaK [Paludibacteraceae bacterium]
AYEKKDADACEAANNALMTAFQAASAEMYAAQQQAGQQAGGQSTSNGEASNGANGSNGQPTAEDVDFEEVK